MKNSSVEKSKSSFGVPSEYLVGNTESLFESAVDDREDIVCHIVVCEV
jgi:hypothetical protein